MKRLTTDTFIEKSLDLHDNRYIYDKCEYINTRSKVKIKCPEHGYFDIIASNHLHNKQGCVECIRDNHRFEELSNTHINDLNQVHYSFYEYKKIVKDGKIEIKCPEHGWFNQSYYNHIRGHGCSFCSSSKGEKKIKKLLDSKGINYLTEKTFGKCISPKNRKLRFDFYLPNKNVCIEYDGIQHFESKEYFGGDKFLKYIQICDNIKNKFCGMNGIKLIRISYKEGMGKLKRLIGE